MAMLSGDTDRELLDIEAVEERIQQALHRRDVRARVSGVVAPLVTLVILLIVWEAVVRLFRVPLYLVPGPTQVVEKLGLTLPLLVKHGWVTRSHLINILVSYIQGERM